MAIYSSREPAQSSRERLWSVEETASYIGVARSTIYRWLANGIGAPPVRLGGRTLFRKSAVQEFIAEQEALARAEHEANRREYEARMLGVQQDMQTARVAEPIWSPSGARDFEWAQ